MLISGIGILALLWAFSFNGPLAWIPRALWVSVGLSASHPHHWLWGPFVAFFMILIIVGIVLNVIPFLSRKVRRSNLWLYCLIFWVMFAFLLFASEMFIAIPGWVV